MSTHSRMRNQEEKSSSKQTVDTDGATTIPVTDKNEQHNGAGTSGTNGQKRKPSDQPSDPVAELEEKLAQAKAQAEETYDRFLRLNAEFENYKKRILRETSESRKYANETLLKDLLSVVDNLERALDAAREGENPANGLVDGVEMTLGELLKIFEKFGVKPVESKGKPFDPNYHQAMGQEETDKHPENTVIHEFQKGYTYHDRLLRPAMVIIAKSGAGDK